MATFLLDCYLNVIGDYLTILFEETQLKCLEGVYKYPKINHLSVLNKTEIRYISFHKQVKKYDLK